MGAPAVSLWDAPGAAPVGARTPSARVLDRVRAAVAAVGAAVLGAAPHMLHHVVPLAGAALLAGATGKLLFGAIGFLLAIPMLRRLRRQHGSWAVPAGVLALTAVVFAFSTFVIGPAIAEPGSESAAPAKNVPTAPPGISRSAHESHHR